MSKIKGKDSKIEVAFRKKLWSKGFRYSKNSKNYFGKPDLALPKYETVIFVDSCFWHGCKKHGSIPSTRKKFWTEKINRNKARDGEVDRHYKKKGWIVIRTWEHEMRKNPDELIDRIVLILKNVSRV